MGASGEACLELLLSLKALSRFLSRHNLLSLKAYPPTISDRFVRKSRSVHRWVSSSEIERKQANHSYQIIIMISYLKWWWSLHVTSWVKRTTTRSWRKSRTNGRRCQAGPTWQQTRLTTHKFKLGQTPNVRCINQVKLQTSDRRLVIVSNRNYLSGQSQDFSKVFLVVPPADLNKFMAFLWHSGPCKGKKGWIQMCVYFIFRLFLKFPYP